jgi:hypothetical protein
MLTLSRYVPVEMRTVCPAWAVVAAGWIIQNGWSWLPEPESEQFELA